MIHHSTLSPPLTLAERLDQLNDNLHTLGDRLKEAIASAIGTTAAEAVRDAIRGLLGEPENSPSYSPRDWSEDDRSWHERTWDDPSQNPWMERDRQEPEWRSLHPHAQRTSNIRLRNALGAALQSSLFWLRQEKSRRPVLTTSLIALTAGVTAFFYGPALAAGVGLLTSVASLIMTAESASSAAESLAEIAAG